MYLQGLWLSSEYRAVVRIRFRTQNENRQAYQSRSYQKIEPQAASYHIRSRLETQIESYENDFWNGRSIEKTTESKQRIFPLFPIERRPIALPVDQASQKSLIKKILVKS